MPFQDFTRRLQGTPQPLTLPEYDLPTQIEPVDDHQVAVEKIFGKSRPNFAVDVPDNWNVEEQKPQAQPGKPPKYRTLKDLLPKRQAKAKTVSAKKPGANTGTMSGTVTARNPLTGSAFDPRPKAKNEFDLSFGGPTEAEQMAERALVASGESVGRDTSRKRSLLQKIQDQQAIEAGNRARNEKAQLLKLEGVDTGQTHIPVAEIERQMDLQRMRRQVESENPLTRFGRRFLTTAAGGLKPDEEFINAPVGRVDDAISSVMDSATRGLASIPEGFGRIADYVMNSDTLEATKSLAQLAKNPNLTPEERANIQARISQLHGNLSKVGDYVEPISKAGDAAAKGLYPRDPNAKETVNPLNADFWSHTLPGAAGSMLPFMAAGGVGNALKLSPRLVAGAAGAAMEVPEGYHGARAGGATPEQLQQVTATRIASGGIEALGAESLLGGVGKKLEGSMFGHVTKEGVVEAVQEGGQSATSDLGDKYYAKTKPELTAGQITMNALQNAVPALFLGAGGGAMGIPAHLAEQKQKQIAQQIEQLATTQPDHPVAQTIAAVGIDPTTVSQAEDKAVEELSVRLEAMARMDSQIQQLQGQQAQVQQQILNVQQAQQMGRVPSTVDAQAVQQAPVVEQQLAEAQAQQAAIVEELKQNVSPLFKNLAKAIGQSDAQPLEDIADDPTANLLTEVRKAGGISASDGTVEKGELDRLGIKESGTTGLISRTGGESADLLREQMVSEGLSTAETPQEFIGEVEAATKRKKTEAQSYADYQRSQMTEQEAADSDKLDEVLADNAHPFTQVYRALDNPKTIFTKELARKFDAAAQKAGFSDDFIERSLIEFERQRAAVVPGKADDVSDNRSMKPAEPGVSMSPYKVLEANKKDLLKKLYDTNLNSKDGIDGVNELRDWARANGIEQRHVSAHISDIQNWQKRYGVPQNPSTQPTVKQSQAETVPVKAESATPSSGFSQEQRKLLGKDHTNLLDSEFDEYMEQIENLQNMSVRGKEFGGFDISEAERKGLVSKLIEIRKERKKRVKAKRLPALGASHTKATAPKAELGQQLVEQAAERETTDVSRETANVPQIEQALETGAPANWRGDQAREAAVKNLLYPLLGKDKAETERVFDGLKRGLSVSEAVANVPQAATEKGNGGVDVAVPSNSSRRPEYQVVESQKEIGDTDSELRPLPKVGDVKKLEEGKKYKLDRIQRIGELDFELWESDGKWTMVTRDAESGEVFDGSVVTGTNADVMKRRYRAKTEQARFSSTDAPQTLGESSDVQAAEVEPVDRGEPAEKAAAAKSGKVEQDGDAPSTFPDTRSEKDADRFKPEQFIQLAADSIEQLREQDVFRLFDEALPRHHAALRDYIADNRKDLAKEVDAILAELQPTGVESAKEVTDERPTVSARPDEVGQPDGAGSAGESSATESESEQPKKTDGRKSGSSPARNTSRGKRRRLRAETASLFADDELQPSDEQSRVEGDKQLAQVEELTEPIAAAETVVQAAAENVEPEPVPEVEAEPEPKPKPVKTKPQPLSVLTGASFAITPEIADRIRSGGAVTKYKQNIDAVKTMRQIVMEGRRATVEEQEAMALYAGFGGIKDLFAPPYQNYKESQRWYERQKELKELIGEDAYKAASASTKNAHFTDPQIVDRMWTIAEKLGFTRGRMLEPSMGSGNFFGLVPAHLRDKTTFTGVELDKTTGQMAQLLYPDANIHVQGFEDFNAPDNFFDLAMGNVPFGEYRISDNRYNKLLPQIHNYFFLKALDKVRPGGLVMFITSTGTMDSKRGEVVRKELAKQADLVTAIRFPAETFGKTALTSVVTDLIILRKRMPGEVSKDQMAAPFEWETDVKGGMSARVGPITLGILPYGKGQFEAYQGEKNLGVFKSQEAAQEALMEAVNKSSQNVPVAPLWTKTAKVPDPRGLAYAPVQVNSWMAANRQNMLGDFNGENRMYPGRANVDRTDDFEQRFTEAIAALPSGIMTDYAPSARVSAREAGVKFKDGGYVVKDGQLMQNVSGGLAEVEGTPDRIRRVEGLIAIRDAFDALIDGEMGRAPIGTARKDLNSAYDKFVGKYGPIGDKKNREAMAGDPDLPRLMALESYDSKKKTAKKQPVFTKATVVGSLAFSKPANVEEGVVKSFQTRGEIILSQIAADLGLDEQTVAEEMVARKIAFQTPQGNWELAAHYLSGNVRRKLAEAKIAAASDSFFQANVDVLENVVPRDIQHTQIAVEMGAPWMEPDVISRFVAELFGDDPSSIRVHYDRKLGSFNVGMDASARAKASSQAMTTWGTPSAPFSDLLDLALSGKSARITETMRKFDGTTIQVFNPEKTQAANTKLEAIKKRFREWLWENDERRERLLNRYNDLFNSQRPAEYDVKFMLDETGGGTVPGLAAHIKLREHQVAAVFRAVIEKRGLLAHEVGLGKTLAMLASASELKRMGIARKPAIAVPKKVINAFKNTARDAFPLMKVHVIDSSDAQKRNTSMSQVATGDHDLILMTHDNMDMLKMKPEFEAEMIQIELDEVNVAYNAMKAEKGAAASSKRVLKQIENRRSKLEAKINDALKSERKDDAISFEDTGIDFLFVDEFHKYKSLPVVTALGQVKGVPTGDSQRALNMLMRARYLQRIQNGGGLIAATGTPVSNTLVEAWIMAKFLQPDLLEESGVESFDAWVRQFAETVPALEMGATGEWKTVSRMSKFKNLPELQVMSRMTLDVKTAKETGILDVRPKRIDKVIQVSQTEAQAAFMQVLRERATAIKNRSVEPWQDNYLVLTSDGMQMALDPRMVLPGYKEEGGKIKALAENVARILKEKPGNAQMIFCDSGVAPNAWGFHLYEEIIKKLEAGGIPRDKIINFSKLDTDKKVENAVARLNSGEALIALGHRENMGTGINAQKKLAAVHQFDVPWKPALVEQSEARAWRQGNENKEIEILPYVTTGSFDGVKWSTIARKQQGIAAFMQKPGEDAAREWEDSDDDSLSYDQIAAAASGDGDYLRKAELDAKVFKLSMMQQAHDSEALTRKQEIPRIIDRIAAMERRADQVERIATAAKAIKEKEFAYQNTKKETIEDRKDAAKDISSAYLFSKDKHEKTVLGYYKGLRLMDDGWGNSDIEMPIEGSEIASIKFNVNTTEFSGTLQSIEQRISGLASDADAKHIKEVVIPGLQDDLAKLQAVTDTPFPFTEQLQKTRAQSDAVNKRLKAKEAESTEEGEPLQANGVDVRAVSALGRQLRRDLREKAIKPSDVEGILEKRLPEIEEAAKDQMEVWKAFQRRKAEDFLADYEGDTGLAGMAITAKSANKVQAAYDPEIDAPSSMPPPASRRTRESVESSPEFKRWFGDSKVVDRAGKPMPLYHGTQARNEIEAVDPSRFLTGSHFGPGFYMAESPEIASQGYAEGHLHPRGQESAGTPSVYKLYARIENPLDVNRPAEPKMIAAAFGSPNVDLEEMGFGSRPTNEMMYKQLAKRLGDDKEAVNQKLQEMGYDGITRLNRASNESPEHREWVVFDPRQVKSATGNRGTFDDSANLSTSRREAGGPASKLANPYDVFSNSQAIVKYRGSRGARMYVNDYARSILGASLTEVFGDDHSNVNAINLSRDEVSQIATYLETASKQLGTSAEPGSTAEHRQGAEQFVTELRDLLKANPKQRTFNIVDVTAYESRQQSGIRSDRERAAENLKGDIREEGFHWSQREVSGQSVALVGSSWAQSSKGFGKYRRKLIELGYPDDPETLAAEIAAKIAAGKFDDLGIRTEADHEQAQNWLASYFERVAEKHGIEALEKFDRLLPKAKEAKAKGAQSVKERLRERIEQEQAQSGGTNRPRSLGGQSQRVRGTDESGQKDSAQEVRRRSADEPFESTEPVKGPQLTIDERTNAENVRRPGEEAPEFSSVKGSDEQQVLPGIERQDRLRLNVREWQNEITDRIEAAKKGVSLDYYRTEREEGTKAAVKAHGRRGEKTGSVLRLPYAKAISIKSKIGLVNGANKYRVRQAEFLSGINTSLQNAFIASAQMNQAKPGSPQFLEAEKVMDKARLSIVRDLSRLNLKNTIDTVTTIARASLLSAPHIPVANIVEGIASATANEASKLFRPIYSKIWAKKWGIDTKAPGFSAGTLIQASKQGASLALADFKNAFKYHASKVDMQIDLANHVVEMERDKEDRKSFSVLGGVDKYDSGGRPRTPVIGDFRIGGGFDLALQFVFDLQGAADAPVRSWVFARSLGAQAKQIADSQAKEKGWSDKERDDYQQGLMKDPTPLMVVIAGAEANNVIHNEATTLVEVFNKGKNYLKTKSALSKPLIGLLDLVVPFTRIPAAAAKAALWDYAPWGGLYEGFKGVKAAQLYKDTGIAVEPEEAARMIRTMGQSTVGTSLYILFATLAAQGMIGFFGSRDDDWRKAMMQDQLGEDPGGVTVGDAQMSTKRLGPVGQGVAVGGQIAKDFERREGEKDDAYSKRKRLAIPNAVIAQFPLLDRVKRLVEDYQRTGMEGTARGLARPFTSLGVLRDVAQVTDDVKRDTQEEGRTFVDRVIGEAKTAIPGVRNEMPPKIGPAGRPMPQSNPFNILGLKPQVQDRSLKKVKDMGLGLNLPKRESDESAESYNVRASMAGEANRKIIDSFFDDPNLIGQPEERKKVLLHQELSTEGRARLEKIAPEDVADDRMVRAWIQIGVDRLKANPVYQQMSEMEQKHALQSYYGRMNRYKAQPANAKHEYLRPDIVDEDVLQQKIKAAIESQQDN